MSDNLDLDEYGIDHFELENSADAAADHESTNAQTQEPVTQIDDLGVQDLGVDSAVAATRVRKPIPKLDADRLLNPYKGYPALLKDVKRSKYRKGHERRYLQKYVMIHQIWANRVWPKANFDDFILIARKAGKDPRIRSYIRDLIENEKYGHRSESRHRETSAQRESEQLENRKDTSKESDAQQPPHQLLSEHTKDLPKDTNLEIASSVPERFEPEIDDRISDRELEESIGPDEDELEAARELYGDMDF